jgi:putative ABC transport system permease protein
MFFLVYLRSELLRRRRQAIVVALGLAIGVGLVVTVSAASTGVRKAQDSVLHSLYGIGTDATVSTAAPHSSSSSHIFSAGSTAQHDDLMMPTMGLGVLDASAVPSIARVHGVAAAAGGLTLTDVKVDLPSASDLKNGTLPTPVSTTVDGLDVSHPGIGPYASAKPQEGRSLAAADTGSDVAVVDSAYAEANGLHVGSKITIARTAFTVVGIVRQPQSGNNAANVYIPLDRAQAISVFQSLKSLNGKVTTIYVATRSSADLPAVQKAINRLLPGATVTSSSNLASAVSGSLSSANSLATDLGRWLAILSVIAAFALASLLTLAAVTRRIREIGTLKALGWRSRRIVAQFLGESIVAGVVGACLGIGLGLGGATLVQHLAPKLSATVAENPGTPPPQVATVGDSGTHVGTASGSMHTVTVHLTAPMTASAIALAVVLAIAGGLVAGSFGGWRAARLMPAEALGRVG